MSLFAETCWAERGALTANGITNVIKMTFDCRPGAIAMSLALRELKYQEAAADCRFGRKLATKDGFEHVECESAQDLSKHRPMTLGQVLAALEGSNSGKKAGDHGTAMAAIP